MDDLVRPYVHKILVVIEPLLIDEDYYARVEGREIISNLAKAAGLATMISTMRPDIDNIDEYVRNTTARAFAVVASSLGIPSLLPFLKAVCKSKKSCKMLSEVVKVSIIYLPRNTKICLTPIAASSVPSVSSLLVFPVDNSESINEVFSNVDIFERI